MQLRRAILFVKDLPRMTAFYSTVLGVKPVDESHTDSWAEFDTGGATLALHAIPSDIAGKIEITQPPRVREENPIKLVFTVADVESERVRLEALDVNVVSRPWGACDGIDPEGNVFQICKLNS